MSQMRLAPLSTARESGEVAVSALAGHSHEAWRFTAAAATVLTDPETNVVDAHVARLRRKLETGDKPLIHTVRGMGYVLEDRSAA